MEGQKLSQIKKIGEKYDLDFVVLFGSQAKSPSIGQESDLDIAIYKRGEIKSSVFPEIYFELSQIFKGQNLDLKTLPGSDPLLRFYIMKDGIPLYIKDTTFYHEFFSFAYKDFHDSQSLFRLTQLMQEKRQKILERKYAW